MLSTLPEKKKRTRAIFRMQHLNPYYNILTKVMHLGNEKIKKKEGSQILFITLITFAWNKIEKKKKSFKHPLNWVNLKIEACIK